jgi:hypothetical protein
MKLLIAYLVTWVNVKLHLVFNLVIKHYDMKAYEHGGVDVQLRHS